MVVTMDRPRGMVGRTHGHRYTWYIPRRGWGTGGADSEVAVVAMHCWVIRVAVQRVIRRLVAVYMGVLLHPVHVIVVCVVDGADTAKRTEGRHGREPTERIFVFILIFLVGRSLRSNDDVTVLPIFSARIVSPPFLANISRPRFPRDFRSICIADASFALSSSASS